MRYISKTDIITMSISNVEQILFLNVPEIGCKKFNAELICRQIYLSHFDEKENNE